MANRLGPEERHQQSVAPLLEAAQGNDWNVQQIEHDGIRQYRFTRTVKRIWKTNPRVTFDHYTVSAYFEHRDADPDEGVTEAWRFVIGFEHHAPEVPLRLGAVAERLARPA